MTATTTRRFERAGAKALGVCESTRTTIDNLPVRWCLAHDQPLTQCQPRETVPMFVYGSLRPGMPLWDNWLAGLAQNVREHAWVRASLWMTKRSGYPWLTFGDQNVSGTLVDVAVGPDLQRLANMEIGAGYVLDYITVKHAGSAQPTQALVFRYPTIDRGFIPVPGQDWSTWERLGESLYGRRYW